MDANELVALLKQAVKKEGIHKFAERHDICVGYLTNVLYCGAKPGPKITLALGYKKVVSFEPVK